MYVGFIIVGFIRKPDHKCGAKIVVGGHALTGPSMTAAIQRCADNPNCKGTEKEDYRFYLCEGLTPMEKGHPWLGTDKIVAFEKGTLFGYL